MRGGWEDRLRVYLVEAVRLLPQVPQLLGEVLNLLEDLCGVAGWGAFRLQLLPARQEARRLAAEVLALLHNHVLAQENTTSQVKLQ